MIHTVTLARHAMATRFEMVLHGADSVALRAAGEEALQEVENLEAQLSLFRPTSEIAQVNAQASRSPVRVSPAVFSLLLHAKTLWEESGGTFDPTIAPLLNCWGFLGGKGSWPREGALAEAGAITGMHLVELDPGERTVRFTRPGVMLDLGAIGKGYAIQVAADLLRDLGVNSGLIHGGTSTVYALGRPPDSQAWSVAIDAPPSEPDEESSVKPSSANILATVPLQDQALSISAVWGKCFRRNGKAFGHVLDPRSGQPVENALMAAVVTDSATETDALSTAMLVGGASRYEIASRLRPGMRSLLLTRGEKGTELRSNGIETRSNGLEQAQG
jgi:thiamine biosynthesis lipoprotein